jgi:hypothetical protein
MINIEEKVSVLNVLIICIPCQRLLGDHNETDGECNMDGTNNAYKVLAGKCEVR